MRQQLPDASTNITGSSGPRIRAVTCNDTEARGKRSEGYIVEFDNCRGRRVAWALACSWGLAKGPGGEDDEQRTSRLINLRGEALSWTTEGINNAVKYFTDFVECVCGVRSRRTHLSRSIGPTSIVNGNKRPNAGCEQCADDVTCLCKATLTVGRTGGEGRYTGNLQIPLENLALRFRGASRVKSSLMYAQMLPPCTCAQYARLRAAPDYHSFVPRIPGSIVSIIRIQRFICTPRCPPRRGDATVHPRAASVARRSESNALLEKCMLHFLWFIVRWTIFRVSDTIINTTAAGLSVAWVFSKIFGATAISTLIYFCNDFYYWHVIVNIDNEFLKLHREIEDIDIYNNFLTFFFQNYSIYWGKINILNEETLERYEY